MSSFKNYMPPKYTYQKAENQTTGASFALSLSLSPLAHAQVQVTCSPTGGKVGWAVEHTEQFKESGSYTERNSSNSTRVREKNVPNTWAPPLFCRTSRQWAEHCFSWRHVNCTCCHLAINLYCSFSFITESLPCNGVSKWMERWGEWLSI